MSKVLFGDWYKAVEFNKKELTTLVYLETDGDPVAIEVKRNLSFEERYRLITDIFNMCVHDREFRVDLFEFALNYYLLSYYTNLNCNVSLDHIYELIMLTDIISQVTDVVGKDVVWDIRHDAQERCFEVAHATKESEALAERLNHFLDDVKNSNAVNPESLDELLKLAEHIDSNREKLTSEIIDFQKKRSKKSEQ